MCVICIFHAFFAKPCRIFAISEAVNIATWIAEYWWQWHTVCGIFLINARYYISWLNIDRANYISGPPCACAGNTSILPYYFKRSASRLVIDSSLVVSVVPVSDASVLLTVAGERCCRDVAPFVVMSFQSRCSP